MKYLNFDELKYPAGILNYRRILFYTMLLHNEVLILQSRRTRWKTTKKTKVRTEMVEFFNSHFVFILLLDDVIFLWKKIKVIAWKYRPFNKTIIYLGKWRFLSIYHIKRLGWSSFILIPIIWFNLFESHLCSTRINLPDSHFFHII